MKFLAALVAAVLISCGGSTPPPAQPGDVPNIAGDWKNCKIGNDRQFFGGQLKLTVAGPDVGGSANFSVGKYDPNNQYTFTVEGKQEGTIVFFRLVHKTYDPVEVTVEASATKLEGGAVGSGFVGEEFTCNR